MIIETYDTRKLNHRQSSDKIKRTAQSPETAPAPMILNSMEQIEFNYEPNGDASRWWRLRRDHYRES